MNEHHFPYFVRTTAPTQEPISLTEAKAFLRINGTADDSLLQRLIVAARDAAESYLQRSLITQSWQLAYDDYAPSRILLPRGPVQSITSVKMVAQDGSTTTVPGTAYRLNAGREILNLDSPLISHIVEISYVTGFGGPSAVPSAIRQGLYAHVAEMYEKRLESIPLSRAAQALYQPYRVMSL